jgi:hypothetical protein
MIGSVLRVALDLERRIVGLNATLAECREQARTAWRAVVTCEDLTRSMAGRNRALCDKFVLYVPLLIDV